MRAEQQGFEPRRPAPIRRTHAGEIAERRAALMGDEGWPLCPACYGPARADGVHGCLAGCGGEGA